MIVCGGGVTWSDELNEACSGNVFVCLNFFISGYKKKQTITDMCYSLNYSK